MAEIFTGNESVGSGGIIDDNNVGVQKTYSSQKIENKLDLKADKANGVVGDILVRDADGNPVSSGKKTGDFATSGHSHNATAVTLSTTNFTGVLPTSINTLQKLADFIDDNIGLGRSLEFDISGTQLGIKQEGDAEFAYIDVQGEQGAGLEFNWNGTQLGVRVAGSGLAFSYVDLEGPAGQDGNDGLDGKDLEFIWSGTQLGVRLEGETTYTYRELKGETGNGILSVVRTSGNGTPGTTDTYTITYTDNSTDTFTVTNGANGEGAMQTVSTVIDSLIQIDNTDPANPVFSLTPLTEADITDLDKYTKSEVVDLINTAKTELISLNGALATLDTVNTAQIENGAITNSKIANGTISESNLSTSVNNSLDLADSALQSGDIGVSVQAYDVNTAKTDVANTFTQGQTISNATGDSLELNGTGTNNTVLRMKDDGLERGFIGVLNGLNQFNIRSANDLYLTSGGSLTTGIIVKNGGNVGINNTNPTAKIHTIGTSKFEGTMQVGNSGAIGGLINIGYTGVGTYRSAYIFQSSSTGDMQIWNQQTARLQFATSNSVQMTISDTGKVGFGTVSGTGRVNIYQNDSEVGNNAGLIIEQDGTGDAIIQFLLTGVRRWVAGIDNSDSDKFKISATADVGTGAFQIDTAGNVMVKSSGWTGDPFSIGGTYNFFRGGHNVMAFSFSITTNLVTETGYPAEIRHLKSGSGGKGDMWICVDDETRAVNDNIGSLYSKPVAKFGAERIEFRANRTGTGNVYMGGYAFNSNTNTHCHRIGGYYFWIDATGDFRMHSTYPTSDTSGIVVGAQS